MKEEPRSNVRVHGRSDSDAAILKPVDGFVVGGDAAWESGENLWLLLSKPGERLIDFFLEDDDGEGVVADPVPCACAGVGPDGTVLISEVDWELDRFLSELLDERSAAKR
jgi:hypothetical protein